MKLLQVILSLCLLLVPLIVIVESSASGENFNNISRGSSISAALSGESSYWLSPSGNIAFGFYPLPCDQQSSSICKYVVGIWFVKSPSKTLVWTANRNDVPLSNPSLIRLTEGGEFVLQTADNKVAPLIHDMHDPVSYAMMHDDGNFVLYGSDSQIVWQSFDHPTDTILGGQKLKDAVDLVSGVSLFNPGTGKYKLSVNQNNGLVAIYEVGHLGRDEYASDSVVSEANYGSLISKPLTLNLEIGGNLYLVGSDNAVIRVLHEEKIQQHEEEDVGKVYIYRATLDSKGFLNLYKERIDGVGGKKHASVLLWSTYIYWTYERVLLYALLLCVFLFIFIAGAVCIAECVKNDRRRKQEVLKSGLEGGV